MSLKKDLIKHLNLIADLLEYKGANKFKVSAYKNASNAVRRIEGNPDEMIDDGSIGNVKGIGKGILKVIMEFAESGSSTDLDELRSAVPEEVIDLFGIRGIGAGKIKLLNEQLGVDNIESLEKVCKSGEISKVKGFGSKLQSKILEEIKLIKRSKGYMLLHKALENGEAILRYLNQLELLTNVEYTGQLRRKLELIDKFEFIAAMGDYKKNYIELTKLYEINSLEESSSYIKLNMIDDANREIVLFLTNEDFYQYVWVITTGSDEYLQPYREQLLEKKYETEEELFQKVGIGFIIPEMREGALHDAPSEFQENSSLTFEQFKGFLHFHTTKSDGQDTLDEMTASASEAGFEYFAVCDHSKAAFYANGLTEDRILLQRKEIEELRSKRGRQIFQGIESDILRDGALDYDDDILKSFDFIVASIHSIFNLSEEEMTSRMIRAIENPFTHVLAHPTGRLLLARDPYKVNIKKVIDACSANDVAIEINANPYRLDLDWRNIYYAREKGCKFAINPDAHSTEGIMDTNYGIMMARKGGIQPEEVINCYSLEDFKQFLNRKVKRLK